MSHFFHALRASALNTRLSAGRLDTKMLSDAIGSPGVWSSADRRLAAIDALGVCAWITAPLLGGALPPGLADDGVIAILGALLLFVVPAGDGRPILVWKEAKAAPWDIIMMFGGGLVLAEAITRAGLAVWLGERLTRSEEHTSELQSLMSTSYAVFCL